MRSSSNDVRNRFIEAEMFVMQRHEQGAQNCPSCVSSARSGQNWCDCTSKLRTHVTGCTMPLAGRQNLQGENNTLSAWHLNSWLQLHELTRAVHVGVIMYCCVLYLTVVSSLHKHSKACVEPRLLLALCSPV